MATFWDTKADLIPKRPERVELSVGDLAKKVKAALAKLPDPLRVRGEIGSWNRAASGHCYFTLKEAKAGVDCKMWQGKARSLKFEPQVGQEVVVTARADFWEVRGQFSLTVDEIDPVGAGALEIAYQQLLEKLKKEGLFEPSRKQAIPNYPQRIAIVSSAEAAGFADALKVLRRFRFLKLFLVPVPVQGNGAGDKIAAGLRYLDLHHDDVGGLDLVLLIRGGGSREDLWAFNEEPVARAIASMRLPTVTGIGHETDTLIADLVADERAHTPTAAAERAVRFWAVARERVENRGVVLRRGARRAWELGVRRYETYRRHEGFRRPTETIERRRQQVDEAAARLSAALLASARGARDRLRHLAAAVERHHPRSVLRLQRNRVESLGTRLVASGPRRQVLDASRRLAEAGVGFEAAAGSTLAQRKARLALAAERFRRATPAARLPATREQLKRVETQLNRAVSAQIGALRTGVQSAQRQLAALDPTAVLRRGYSLTYVRRGDETALVRTAAEVVAGDVLVTRLGDGTVQSEVREEGLDTSDTSSH